MSETPAFTVEIDGVDIGFRDLKPGQFTMITVIMNNARRDARKIGEAQASMKMLASIFNIIESTVILEEDREHLMDAMMRGVIDVPEAYLILRRGAAEEPDDDQDEVEQPRKAKKTASTNRVQR